MPTTSATVELAVTSPAEKPSPATSQAARELDGTLEDVTVVPCAVGWKRPA